MLVLKAGETMDLADLAPSRMERARLKIADFAAERKGQPLGLVAYAGSAHLVLPPTRDTSVVAAMAAEISPAVMPEPGDDLAQSLTAGRTNAGRFGRLDRRAGGHGARGERICLARVSQREPAAGPLPGGGSCGHAGTGCRGECGIRVGASVTLMTADSSDMQPRATHRESSRGGRRRRPREPAGRRPAGGCCRCWPCFLWRRFDVCSNAAPSETMS